MLGLDFISDYVIIFSMKNLIAEITKAVANINGVRFASLTYLSKSAGELARYTISLGFSYHNLVEKSKTELEILIAENKALPAGHADKWNALQQQAAANVMASLNKTLEAHERGEQNADYTKAGQYVAIGNGLSLNTGDSTLQLFGLVNTKTVLVPGEYKKVNSKPLTIAQNEIRGQLSVSRFREFALDESQIAQVKVSGETLEFVPA